MEGSVAEIQSVGREYQAPKKSQNVTLATLQANIDPHAVEGGRAFILQNLNDRGELSTLKPFVTSEQAGDIPKPVSFGELLDAVDKDAKKRGLTSMETTREKARMLLIHAIAAKPERFFSRVLKPQGSGDSLIREKVVDTAAKVALQALRNIQLF